MKFESQHPPHAADGRGAYFDGVRDYLRLENFEPFSQSRFDFWILVTNPGTIFSMHELSIGEWHDNAEREGNSHYDDDGRYSQPFIYDANSIIGLKDF